MTTKLYDVIIAGAGPVGLFLACELGLARASVLVLERDPKQDSAWKAAPLGFRGLNMHAIEGFYRRGMLDKLFEGTSDRGSGFQKTPGGGFQRGGHVAGIMLNANKLELDRWKYRLNGPALVPGPIIIDHVEKILTERADGLGVTILRGKGVSKIVAEDGDSVTVDTTGGESRVFQGKWLVGCDGGRSVVRKAGGFDFVGTEANFTGYAAQVELDPPDRLKPGFNRTDTGMYITGPMPGTLYLVDFEGAEWDRTQEITKEHLQEILHRTSGMTDVKIKAVHLASSFTDRSKQVSQYRKGRILLAGDAAHIHGPLGSQGLNAGIGDALNLGWKLAATLRRERESAVSTSTSVATSTSQEHQGHKSITNTDTDTKDPALGLLDTYQTERHPVGAWVLDWTRAQVAMLRPGPHGAAIYALVKDLANTTDGTNLLIEKFWGLSQRYVLGDGDGEEKQHPLVGSSAPDFEFIDGSRLGDKMAAGKGLLVDFETGDDDWGLRALVVGVNGVGEEEERRYGGRVEYVNIDAKNTCGLRALLIRPDGIVAWVAEEDGSSSSDDIIEKRKSMDVEAAKAALEKWFSF